MTRFATALVALMLLLPGASQGATGMLEPVKKIGVAWGTHPSEWMSYVAFSPDGTKVASDGPGPDGALHGITIWRFPDGRFLRSLESGRDGLSPDWNYYVGKDSVVDVRTGKSLFPVAKVSIHAFSRDSRYYAEYAMSGNGDHAGTRVVELSSGRQVSTIDSAAFSLAISPDDRILAVGRWGIVTLWDLQTGKRLAVLRGFERYVDALSFSPNVAGKDYGGIEIWDVRRRRRIHAVPIEGGYPSPAFSPDSRRIAVGTYGTGTAWLVDAASGKIVDQAQVSGLGCGSVSFSPDGRYLIAPSTGGLVTWPYDDGGGTIHVLRVRPAGGRR
jgi:WD40 repeat protein